ncbi:LysM peptidoglycan-binding domain-containing protein [Ureibacillus massiliensis]
MKRLILAIVVVLFSFPVVTSAQGFDDYVVQKGDSLWKIAVKF